MATPTEERPSPSPARSESAVRISKPEFLSELDAHGGITYRPPSPMRVGERYEVEARIAAGEGEPGGVPKEEFTRGLPGQGPPTVAELPVGPRMLVELKDPADAFDIDPITPAEQSVQERTITIWEWSVAPRRKGQHVLKLTATAVIGEDRTPYRVYDAPISVQANPRYTLRSFMAHNWQALLAAVASLGGLALAVLTFAHSRKQQAGVQHGDSGAKRSSKTGTGRRRKAKSLGGRASGGRKGARGQRRRSRNLSRS